MYIYLFFRTLKESAVREAKYQGMIENLSENIQKGIENIQDRLDVLSPNMKRQE